jgi:transposase
MKTIGGDTMAKYRTTDVAAGQSIFLTVNLNEQLLPGTFEHMLNEIIGTKIDLSVFDKKYKNDLTGASAVPPSILLKLTIYGYSKGRKSSRELWELNNSNIIAKALTGDMAIHWTTIADFISSNSKEFADTFVKVLTYSNELGLIGGETFAIDGLRLPSNASMEMSGTKKQLEKRLSLYRKMSEKHLERHLKKDGSGEADARAKERFENRQKLLNRRIEKISVFLEETDEKTGKGGKEIQSNVTDNESAMIHSSKGFLQGYIGIAVSDRKDQIITSACAAGTANEGEHLPEMLDMNEENLALAGARPETGGLQKKILGDANYFSEDNFRECEERGIEAFIPDSQEKRRFNSGGEKRFELDDFKYNEEEDYYECPHGKRLEFKRVTRQAGVEGRVYQASLTDCKACPVFSRCSWSRKEQSGQVQGKTVRITEKNRRGNLCRKTREKQATEEYQALYAKRIQIIEPVFANIRHSKGLNRFTLRGKEKVNGQWLLFCIVHNLGKCLNGRNAVKRAA